MKGQVQERLTVAVQPADTVPQHLPLAAGVPRFRLALGALVVALVVGLALVLASDRPVGAWNPVLALMCETASVVALGFITAMIWVRYREHGPVHVLFQCSAFVVLFLAGGVWLLLVVSQPTLVSGPLIAWWWTIQWLLAGGLLILGAELSLRRPSVVPAHPRLIAFGPGLATLLMAGVLAITTNDPMSGVHPSLLDGLSVAPRVAYTHTLDVQLMLRHFPVAAVLLVAALSHVRLYERAAHPSRAWIAAGLVLAAGSQLFAAFMPDHAPVMATPDDVLRVLFVGLVMIGTVTASQASLRSLRVAYEELHQARTVELEQAALRERTRLAREIHDNLIQSLWLARLRQGHVLGTDLPSESRALAEEVVSALDEGLGEARDVMMALAPGPDGPLPFDRVLAQSLARQAERLDLDVALAVEGTMPVIEPRVQGELLTIAREALMNIAKHADAAVVRVRLKEDGGRLVLEIADNGNGFDPEIAKGGFGLRSMRQRATGIGATVAIDSRPLDGTRVTVVLPRATAGGRQ